MTRSGDLLVNPATGLRTIFRKTSQETDGDLLQVEWVGDPGWTTGPDHVHRLQNERFEVLSGTLGLRVDGAEYALGAGEVLVAAAGVAHAAWNAGSDDVRVLVDFRPALRTAVAFETLAALAQQGRTTKAGAPRNPLLAALILRHFEDEIFFVRPPLIVQRPLLGAMAAIARAIGLRPEHRYLDARESRPIGLGTAGTEPFREHVMESLQALTLVAATLTVGLMAGVLGLYAQAIMPGLPETDDRTFVGAFGAIDRAIVNPLFLGTFLSALVVTGLAASLHTGDDAHSVLPWIVAALMLYGAAFAITIRIHVPRYNAIKAVGAPDATVNVRAIRRQFGEATWVRWNLVRAVMSTAAFGCLAWALVLHGPG